MHDSVEIQHKTSLLCSHRFWFNFSSFTVVFCILLFASWAATDASYRLGIYKAGIATRLLPIRSTDPEMIEAMGITDVMRQIKWDSIGKRVISIYVLLSVGIFATFIVFFLALRRLTLKRSIVCMALLAAWLLLYWGQNTLNYGCTQRQIMSIFPQFEQVGMALHRQWPTESGEILPGKKFFVWPEKYPGVLAIPRGIEGAYPYYEDFGFNITRGETGIIRLELAGAYDFIVEFYPNGTTPTQYVSGFGNPSSPVASVTSLSKKWFLVRYGDS
ncbi:MAG: hypothetical protein KDA77_16980 [Planctomycetaceae bacterium]|nr:hypothetical protein [Planctomycetaceae bacterium]